MGLITQYREVQLLGPLPKLIFATTTHDEGRQ